MEKIKRCRKCGARLLEHEKRCPVCGTPVGLDKEVDIIKEEQIIEPEKVDEFIAADKTEQTLLKSNENLGCFYCFNCSDDSNASICY